MNPKPFEALNHLTVPCSFTCKPHMRNSAQAGVVDIGIALRLLDRFQRPQSLSLQPLERVKRKCKSYKRLIQSTTRRPICPWFCGGEDSIGGWSKYMKIN